MLNKLERFIRQYEMVKPGDAVVCAVSGGADSVALLFGLYLLAQKLHITLSAAHFNHHLRGEESDWDEAFVRQFCARYNIPLQVGQGEVVAGKKGLEAAARAARYGFFQTLSGKIATAHTADDNAETLVMHMIRGTGLKGLGGIAPINENLIRPMLSVTRNEVLSFIEEYHLDFVTDSSNDTDVFLRNRIRHHIMPLLKQENPKLAENLSATALRLREDEQVLSRMADGPLPDVSVLRTMAAPLRRRTLAAFLEQCGVLEPEAEHIALAEDLVFSDKPSAKADFPGNVVICRNYDKLEKLDNVSSLESVLLPCPGAICLPEAGVRVTCAPADEIADTADCFTVAAQGEIFVRSRQSGDSMKTAGGTKTLKKLFIDSKLPASRRWITPVIADSHGVLGVYGFGANKDRLAKSLPAIKICFEKINKGNE